MKLQQAREAIGRHVVYRSPAQRAGRDKSPAEVGTIKSVGRQVVFVDYGWGVAGTRPEDLDLEIVTAADNTGSTGG